MYYSAFKKYPYKYTRKAKHKYKKVNMSKTYIVAIKNHEMNIIPPITVMVIAILLNKSQIEVTTRCKIKRAVDLEGYRIQILLTIIGSASSETHIVDCKFYYQRIVLKGWITLKPNGCIVCTALTESVLLPHLWISGLYTMSCNCLRRRCTHHVRYREQNQGYSTWTLWVHQV